MREAAVIDDYGTEQERAAARALDTDTHWSQVDVPSLDPGGSNLTFMDPVGFRYHIPVYMTLTLEYGIPSLGGKLEANCLTSATNALTSIGETMWRLHKDRPPTIGQEQAEYESARLRILSTAQRQCCARYLVLTAITDRYDDHTHAIGYRWWLSLLPPDERAEANKIWTE